MPIGLPAALLGALDPEATEREHSASKRPHDVPLSEITPPSASTLPRSGQTPLLGGRLDPTLTDKFLWPQVPFLIALITIHIYVFM